MNVSDGEVRVKLAAALNALADYQWAISRQAPGIESMTDKEQTDIAATGLMVEAGELYNALRVKPWRPDQDGPRDTTERDRIADEVADVLAFLGWLTHLMGRYGVMPTVLAETFVRKAKINRNRFAGDLSDRGERPYGPSDDYDHAPSTPSQNTNCWSGLHDCKSPPCPLPRWPSGAIKAPSMPRGYIGTWPQGADESLPAQRPEVESRATRAARAVMK